MKPFTHRPAGELQRSNELAACDGKEGKNGEVVGRDAEGEGQRHAHECQVSASRAECWIACAAPAKEGKHGEAVEDPVGAALVTVVECSVGHREDDAGKRPNDRQAT